MFVVFLFCLVVFLNHFQQVNLDLFEVTFLFKFFSLSSKSIFFTKSAISQLVAKFACFNIAVKVSAVNLLNSGVVIYLLPLGHSQQQ